MAAQTDDFAFDEVGFRFGRDDERTIDLNSYEVYGKASTPWNWQMTERLNLDLGIGIAGGTLKGEGETAAYGRVAPELTLSYSDFPVALVVSSGPAYYSRDTFGELDIGSRLQFTSSAGLDWQVWNDWALGYRYQHTANAGLKDSNPGMNLHTVSLGYTF